MYSSESPETVGTDELWSNTLMKKQKEQVAAMRSALISCDDGDPFSVRATLQNIKALRIYHQIVRIIRYTEEMDKIENKLYEAIDRTIETIDLNENLHNSLALLMKMQEQLQKSMIDSQKLLDPYLNIKELTLIDIPIEVQEQDNLISGKVLDQDSRKRLREGAQEVLVAISAQEEAVAENV